MTKYILHGGNTNTPNQLNKGFFAKITSGLADNSQVLIIYFAREKRDYDKLYKQDEKVFLDSAEKHIKLVIATEESFIEEVKKSSVIYMRGGNTMQLLKVLKKYPNFAKLTKGKIVAGSSAGAYILSKYFYSNSEKQIFKGLGIIPVKIICHYTEEHQPIVDKLKKYPDNLELVLLKDYESKVLNY